MFNAKPIIVSFALFLLLVLALFFRFPGHISPGNFGSKGLRICLFEKSDEIIQLGVLKSETLYRYQYIVENKSGSSVSLKDPKTNCLCLEAKITDQTIGPGDSSILEVSLDLRKEPNFKGGLLLDVLIETQDSPPRKGATLYFSVDVE